MGSSATAGKSSNLPFEQVAEANVFSDHPTLYPVPIEQFVHHSESNKTRHRAATLFRCRASSVTGHESRHVDLRFCAVGQTEGAAIALYALLSR